MSPISHSVKINDNDLTCDVCEEYIKPTKSVNTVFLSRTLDRIDEDICHEEHHYGSISPKLFVTDIACYYMHGKKKMLVEFMNNSSFQECMSNENVEFIADLVIYLQWAGSVFAPSTDVFYSLLNTIKEYVLNHWKTNNKTRFYEIID